MATEDVASIFMSASLDESIRIWNVNKPENPICVLYLPKVSLMFQIAILAEKIIETAAV